MKKFLVLIPIIALVFNLNAQKIDSTTPEEPKMLPLWTYYVPGASCFYQKEIFKGALFTTLEAGGVYLGIKYNDQLKSNSTTPYYNYPLFIGLKAFEIEKLANFKSGLEYVKYHRPDFQYHDISYKDLYLAPFKKENVFTPITGGMVLLAGVFLGIEKFNEKHSISEVDEMYFMNRYIHRNDALAVFGTASMALSWGAGVGEEYIFRNYLMPLLDYRLGQKKGLIYSSLFFGAAHFTNVFFAEKPDYGAALLQVAEASILGYFLGRDVQKRAYNIGPAAAAHMWYDAVLMLGSFLINPEENFLGVNVRYGF